MKFLISYLYVNTAISDSELLSALADSIIYHDVIDTINPLYHQCANLKEIEAQYEGMHNYPDEGDETTWPAFRLKVLKMEPLWLFQQYDYWYKRFLNETLIFFIKHLRRLCSGYRVSPVSLSSLPRNGTCPIRCTSLYCTTGAVKI